MFGTEFWSSGRIVHALNPGPFIQLQLSELLFSNRTPCLFHIKTKQNKQPVLILFSLIQGSLVLPSCQALARPGHGIQLGQWYIRRNLLSGPCEPTFMCELEREKRNLALTVIVGLLN